MKPLARIIEKPPHVIAFRVFQEARLQWMHLAQRWRHLEAAIDTWWDSKRVARFAAVSTPGVGVVAADGPQAVRALAGGTRETWADAAQLTGLARRHLERDFALLGAQLPAGGGWPWDTDWRYGHQWRPRYFRSYDLYDPERAVPYDVKVPWELSRLGFVVPVLQAAAFEPDAGWSRSAAGILADWARHNRLAWSVNWYPMEVAMRGIQLSMLLGMRSALGTRDASADAGNLRLLSSHGEFLWRTLEYTDIRGNHYAANLVALLVIGCALQGAYPRAQRWFQFAARRIPREIGLQFLGDGVNFEKSLAYHRLVTELFLLALIVMQRAGVTIPDGCRRRIHAACRYTAACCRPDGWTPNVGDNDDARVFEFDPVEPRDHRVLLGVAGAFFDDDGLRSQAGRMPAAAAWLLGTGAVDAWPDSLPGAAHEGWTHFSAGGVVSARSGDHFFWMDVGEVGMCGRGGHGHNDLLSFELVSHGVPLVIDPGCPVYTGDPQRRNRYRGTLAHNSLSIDDEELAPLQGMWRIGNAAEPEQVRVDEADDLVRVVCTHRGYERLADPVTHTRQVEFDRRRGALTCCDTLESTGPHTARRCLQLAPGVQATLDGSRAVLRRGGRCWFVDVDPSTQAGLEESMISPGYGVEQPATRLVLRDAVQGQTTRKFQIRPA